MGKMKEAVQDWLDDYGYDLGYDMSNYPDIKDWDRIKLTKMKARVYYHNKKAIEQEDLRIKHGFPEPPEVFEDE